VETPSQDADELAGLSADLRAKFMHIAELLEGLGPFQVREPYVKALGGKLLRCA
jgi:hypothetical protein